MSIIHLCTWVLFYIIVTCETSRILAVFPTPSISHQVVFRPLTLELEKRGHEMVVMTPDPLFTKGQNRVNYTEIDVHDISYEIWNKFVETSSGKEEDLYNKMKIAMDLLLLIFEKQLKSSETQKVLGKTTRKFDFIFIEACVRPTIGLSHVHKVPVIQISSFGAFPGTFQAAGAPSHPGIYPSSFHQRINNVTIWEKLKEYYKYFILEKMFSELEESEERVMKRILDPELPNMAELNNNFHMFFLNTYPSWDLNRPVPPNVIYLGGMHQIPPKDLPEELKNYLDSSTNGAIYVSFGTNVQPSLLPLEKIKMFLGVFSTLPYNVLWKWDKDVLEGRPNNVKICKWFPQSDLLRHPNIKLFITQGGLQSTDEALTAGVPLIGIPMIGDQWYNTELYVRFKIGLKLSLESLTEPILKDASDTILNDTRYRSNVVKLHTLMHDQPQSPLERAVWWTEHVLRHGGAKHLRAPAANMPWTQYYELELITITLTILLLFSVVMIYFVKLAVNILSFIMLKIK